MRERCSVPSSEVARAGVSDGDCSAVTARNERLKSEPKRPTKKSSVPSGDLARASGISNPGVALAAARKSKVDSVDSRLTHQARRGRSKVQQAFHCGPAALSRRDFFLGAEVFRPARNTCAIAGRNSQALSRRRSRALGASGRKEGIIFLPRGDQIFTALRSGTGGPSTRIFLRISENFFCWASLSVFRREIHPGGGVDDPA